MTLELKMCAERLRVIDGAWGTELQNRGLEGGLCPELWNIERPDAVEAVACGYVDAGSDVILTNTFGANRFVLDSHGAGNRAAELCNAGAAISRRAAGQNAKVFASIGPSGKIVMMGEVSSEELEMAFTEAATALTHGGAEAIVLETFNELDELEIALKAVRKATNLPVVASMTFSSGPEKTNTMMGNTPGELARLAEECGAEAVGANCGIGPEDYVRVAELLRAATRLPIWVKPNAGLPQVGPEGKTIFPMGPEEFASYVPKLIEAGANFIGGCCGTTPAHIRAIRIAVDDKQRAE